MWHPARHGLRALSLASVVAVAAVAVATIGGVLVAAPASAHAHLTATTPSDGASLTAPPSQVTLSFDDTISHAAVAVEGPDGANWADGDPVTAADTVTQHVRPLGPAGAYAVNYRVVSDDGHVVQGSFSFTLTAAGSSPTVAATPSAATATPLPDATTASSGPVWPLILVAIAIAAVIGGWMLAGRRLGNRRGHGGNTNGGDGGT